MSTPPPSILFVEDSQSVREMLVLLLQEAGYFVAAYENAEAALLDVKARRFGLFILDQELPGMSGLEFLAAARAYQPNTPAIFVAGSLDVSLVVRISHEGVSGIFTKPVDPRSLLRKVAEALEEDRADDRSRPAFAAEFPESRVPRSATTPATDANLTPNPGTLLASCAAFQTLGQRLHQTRDFRSVLLLQGHAGALFPEIAREAVAGSAFAAGPFLECSGAQFESRVVVELLAPVLASDTPGTLLLTEVEDFTPSQFALLQELLGARGPFKLFSQRFRVIVGATAKLGQLAEEKQIDDALYYRLTTLSVPVPPVSELRAELIPLARHFLAEAQSLYQSSATAIDAAAAAWIEVRPWSGDCVELRHWVQTAAFVQEGPDLTVAALAAAETLITTGVDATPHYRSIPAHAPAATPAPIVEPAPPPVSVTTAPAEPVAPAPPEPVGIAKYLPSALTPEEYDAALRSSSSPRPARAPRTVLRKPPGSYDFQKRLQSSLGSDT